MSRNGQGLKLLGCASAVWLLAACSSGEVRHTESVTSVREALSTSGAAVVSVVLRSDLSPAELAGARADIEHLLSDPGSKVLYNFKSGPGMSLLIASDADLQVLATHPAVESFGVSPRILPMFNNAREILGGDFAWYSGYTGAGRTVALLDTGVDASHPDLAEHVVDEVCFCNSEELGPCCPDGTSFQVGPGAAAEADAENGHGTHLAGIITSDGSVAPRGVAPGTNLVVGRVLKGGTFDDVVAALEWLAWEHPEIDAVNLSFGTLETYADNCDVGASEAYITNLANAIHHLRDIGILTVAASGNGPSGEPGDKTAMSAPACISGVISVGATDKRDEPAEFGNQSLGMTLYAPGAGWEPSGAPGTLCPDDEAYCILSTGLGGGTSRIEGTSVAASQVTAAIALIKQASPDLTPDEIEACLLEGPLITDPHPLADGLTKPRLYLPWAIDACGGDVCVETTYEVEQMTHSVGELAPPYGWNLYSNGYVATNHLFKEGPVRIRIRALAEHAGDEAPRMTLSVGGKVVGSTYVTETTYTDYAFHFMVDAGVQEIRISYDNDFYQPPLDRNLWLDFVTIECIEEIPSDGEPGDEEPGDEEPGASPCAGLCSNPTPISWTGSYQGTNLGTGAVCLETTQPIAGGNCGNFAPGRQLLVNGVAMTCNYMNWPTLPEPRNGGYCIQTTPGDYDWAYTALW